MKIYQYDLAFISLSLSFFSFPFQHVAFSFLYCLTLFKFVNCYFSFLVVVPLSFFPFLSSSSSLFPLPPLCYSFTLLFFLPLSSLVVFHLLSSVHPISPFDIHFFLPLFIFSIASLAASSLPCLVVVSRINTLPPRLTRGC